MKNIWENYHANECEKYSLSLNINPGKELEEREKVKIPTVLNSNML